jgi:MFS family permease
VRAALLLFFLTGLVSATWAARIPAVQAQLELSPGELGLAVLGLEAGAVAGLPAGGTVATRLGARAALLLGFAAYPPALLAVALAPGLAALAATLAAMAFANSVVDVAMNDQGAELERRAGRPLLARLHAGHAFGVLTGGLVGTAAAAAGVSARAHFAAVAAGALLVGHAAAHRLPRRALAGHAGGLAWPGRALLLLGAVAFCAFLLDGAAYAWIAVHMRAEHGATPALAAAGFTAFAAALAAGRLAADRLVERHGRANVARAGAALAAAGIGVGLLAPSAWLALAGWATFGAGLAPVAPVVLGAAAGAATLPPAVAIAAVTTVGYVGSFTGPPLVGALAAPLGLTAAMALMAAAACFAALLARPAFGGARGPAGRRPAPRTAGSSSEG